MPDLRTSIRFALSCVAAGLLAGAQPAAAGEVTVTGDFNSYAGPAWHKDYVGSWGTSEVRTRIEAGGAVQDLVPTGPLPGDSYGLYTDSGIGAAQAVLAAPALEFWIDFGAKDDVNAISFTPGPAANVNVGDEFLIGTFAFTNGGWFGSIPVAGGTYTYPESAFGFQILTHSTTPALDAHTFSGTLKLHITGESDGTPAGDADYFYIAERPDLGYVGVYESWNTPPGGANSGTIELWGRIGSLVPTRFANAQGLVLASELPAAPIPEPQTRALLLAGLGLTAWAARRRRSDRRG